MFSRGEVKMINFIPKEYKTDAVTIRIAKEKIEKIDKLAADNNLSRSKFINQCIDFALEHMLKDK